MRSFTGRIIEIGWEPGLGSNAWIECTAGQPPEPGRYLLGWSPEAVDAPLATPLFACRYAENRFQSAGEMPREWEPGAPLQLRGAFGRGFTPPVRLRRAALAAIQTGPARLLPILHQALEWGGEVALFTNMPPPGLPSAVEINPLSALADALTWADYLALDLPLQALPLLKACLGDDRPPSALACPAQALVAAPMPCGGAADCGACAVKTRRGWKSACVDGPVFNLVDLLTF